ncbi:helix-turn-helix transcriptional regulator [Sphingomonas sp. CARO-RG-8B-R24-01]|uniref:helix-turn-helix domain-containing protein n=1 Tax=Sphingomonas sp. CARO-RG-8B-R24-01 TaxID=2914831 RepID=UPI001F598C0E|nr:helix-turn-helix transcriptional regulator [Sphingomonas sp. CARO-RG-8B-R24-01]
MQIMAVYEAQIVNRQVEYSEIAITDESPDDPFPGRLRTARETRELSQTALATKSRLPQSSIAHFEGGARKPSFENLRRLANALQVTTDYLLGRTEDMARSTAADPLFRHVANLSSSDRELADSFLEMLAKRSRDRDGGEGEP